MPGYVIHLAVAEQTLKQIRQEGRNIDNGFADRFKLGSIVPDTKKGNGKYLSHFWGDEEFKRFARSPRLDMFLNKYGKRMKEPYIFGYYSHLYMDNLFMREYWAKHFEFFDKNMNPVDIYELVKYVFLRDDGNVYDRQEFFSDEYYYGDYDRMNNTMIKQYCVKAPDIHIINEISGIKELDLSDAEAELQNMIDLIDNSGRQSIAEELKVFKIQEMHELIVACTNDIVSMYFKIYG